MKILLLYRKYFADTFLDTVQIKGVRVAGDVVSYNFGVRSVIVISDVVER